MDKKLERHADRGLPLEMVESTEIRNGEAFSISIADRLQSINCSCTPLYIQIEQEHTSD